MREVGVGGWTKSVVVGVALVLALLFGAVADALDHGALDPSFTSLRGRVVTSFGSNDDSAAALAIQSDGKIVAAGRTSNGADDDFAVARYRPDGSLDPSFDGDGKVTTPVGSDDDAADAVVVQKDGKIVVAGTSFNGTDDDFAVARYDADGSPDSTFDGDGKVVTPIGSGDDRAFAIALQSDGKIVVAGSSSNGTDDDFALVRYNADGSPDSTFDSDGKVITPIGSDYDRAYAVAIVKGGKLVAAGASWNGSNEDFAVARYNADGSLDTTFDGDGTLTTPIGSNGDAAYAVALWSGKIVAVGSSSNGVDNDFALARYNDDGSLDTTFSGDGKVTTAIGPGDDNAFALLQQDGKLLAAGSAWNGANDNFALARYTKTGAPDTSFGSSGKVTTPISPGEDARAEALAPGGDSRILVAGYASNGSSDDFALARYKSTGSLDVFTSRPGVVTTGFGSGDDVARAVRLAGNGKPVAAGSAWSGSDDDFALARDNADGSPDSSFDGDGKVTASIGSGDDDAYALVLQDAKPVAAGSSWNGTDDDFALARFNVDGSPDTSFDGDGKVTTPVGTGDDVAYAVVVQKDGKIVAAGSTQNGSHDDFVLVRYNPDGSLDASFGTGGIVTTPVGSGAVARALVVQSDGKLVAAGLASNGTDDDVALVRYTGGGTLDPTFGVGGKVLTPIGPGDDDAYALLQQSKDGKLVAAGSSSNGSDNDFALVRYNTNGSTDGSFGGDGKVTTPFGSGDDVAYTLAQQKNLKLIAAGSSWNGSDDDFALARYETNGSLNSPFGSGGKVTTSLGAGNDRIFGVAAQTTTLVAAGEGFNGADEDFAVARYVLCAAAKGC